jgi:hypothetical protein
VSPYRKLQIIETLMITPNASKAAKAHGTSSAKASLIAHEAGILLTSEALTEGQHQQNVAKKTDPPLPKRGRPPHRKKPDDPSP